MKFQLKDCFVFLGEVRVLAPFIRWQHLLGLKILSFFFPFYPRAIYLKGGFLDADWRFGVSDIDLVVILPHDDLDLLQQQRKNIQKKRMLFFCLCPSLFDIDLVLEKHFALACQQQPFYRRDQKKWKLLCGEELRSDSVSITFYEKLEVTYFYILWFCKKWQKFVHSPNQKEERGLVRLLLKWQKHLGLTPEVRGTNFLDHYWKLLLATDTLLKN